LYDFTHSIASERTLEIGMLEGGSAYIISGALDDLGLGGRLITIDRRQSRLKSAGSLSPTIRGA
jgi:predicted O-methyltransferase YrrM